MSHNRIEWESTFDAIDDWICIIDLNSTIRRSNLAGVKLFGLKPHDIIGQKCCFLAHGSNTPVEKCPLPKMIENGKRANSELQIINGRWMFITVDPLFDENRILTGAVHIARDITKRMQGQNERERLYQELKDALAQVKKLSGLVPICSKCKKIRDDKGYWDFLESYIEKHSEASFSHGICPDCSDEIYGKHEWYKDWKLGGKPKKKD